MVGSCSELTPSRWRNETRMEVTGQNPPRLDLSPHCCGSVCPSLRFFPQTSGLDWSLLRLGLLAHMDPRMEGSQQSKEQREEGVAHTDLAQVP